MNQFKVSWCWSWGKGKLLKINWKYSQLIQNVSQSAQATTFEQIHRLTLVTTSFIDDNPITTVSEQLVKSLGRWYNSSLKDKEQVQQLRQEIVSGLENTNKALLPGKLKLWCLQFGLPQPGQCATHCVWSPYYNAGEDGTNHQLVHLNMAWRPAMSK